MELPRDQLFIHLFTFYCFQHFNCNCELRITVVSFVGASEYKTKATNSRDNTEDERGDVYCRIEQEKIIEKKTYLFALLLNKKGL